VARSIPPSLAFEVAEYENRLAALRAAMEHQGVDVLVVTSPANLCYLTGYVASWYAPRLPIGALVHRTASELVFVDWTRHADYVPLTAIHGPEHALAAAERLLRSPVPADEIWWIGGYGLGIAFPPSWVGHTYLANDGPSQVTLRPGYVSNYETILFDREQRFESAAIDTVAVSEKGLQRLSRIPRELLRT
jgi:Xaa-Pro aminopeptidase